ncbi:MAG: type II secretion system protein GspG [Firmicutes bacterium]|nr:type II secretion system protein GspG [Bacillota bacterium]
MRRARQLGFSLLELVVAMTILAVLGTIGVVQFRKHSSQARSVKAHDQVETVSKALDQYYLKHGFYPDLPSFEAMVDANSPLVKQDFMPANSSAKDPWGQSFEGTSTKGTYLLKCLGDPGNPEEYPAFQMAPGRLPENVNAATPAAGAPK